jgi:hypothetical protein
MKKGNVITETKGVISRLKKLTDKLTPEEKRYLVAHEQFINLPAKTKEKYLKIYDLYTADGKTELQVSRELNVSIGTIRNALRLIGDQLIVFAKSRNVLVPQLEKIRRRKQKIEDDISKMNFIKEDENGNEIILTGIADLKRRYLVELRKMEEMENTILGLLNTNVIIDNSSKKIEFNSNYDLTAQPAEINEAKVIDVDK